VSYFLFSAQSNEREFFLIMVLLLRSITVSILRQTMADSEGAEYYFNHWLADHVRVNLILGALI